MHCRLSEGEDGVPSPPGRPQSAARVLEQVNRVIEAAEIQVICEKKQISKTDFQNTFSKRIFKTDFQNRF